LVVASGRAVLVAAGFVALVAGIGKGLYWELYAGLAGVRFFFKGWGGRRRVGRTLDGRTHNEFPQMK
jgi:hypothetical protein